MVKVIGYRDVGFTAQSGEFVEGRTYFLGKDIDTQHGMGVSAEKIFVTDSKLKKFSYMPEIGEAVEVVYNKYGKVIDFRSC